MTDVLSFAEGLLRRCPPWLQRTLGAPFMRGLADPIDDLRDNTAEAIDSRFPRAVRPDALPYLGRDRKIVRGLDEPDSSYAARLLRWREDHKRRGNPTAMLRQLEAYYATAPKQIDLVYETGTRYTLDPTTLDADGKGTISKDAIEWREGNDQLAWAQAWIFVRYDSEPTVTYSEAQSVIAIVRDWAPGHVTRMRIFGIFPDGDLWGYPEGELWGDDDTLYWGAPTAIDFYDIPQSFYLTVGGDYVTVGGDRVTVTA